MTELQTLSDTPYAMYVALEDDGSPQRRTLSCHSPLPVLHSGLTDRSRELVPTTSDVGPPNEGGRQTPAKQPSTAQKKLIQASLICALFMVIETVAGVWANSLALLTDASHLLSDLSSFLISLFALWVSTLPGTRKLSFGYHRAEILGALISVVAIWILTVFLLIEAYHRFSRPTPVNGPLMFGTAFLGTLANLVMTYILGVHSHGLGHQCSGHSHDHEDLGVEGSSGHDHFSVGHHHHHHHHKHEDCASVSRTFDQDSCCSSLQRTPQGGCERAAVPLLDASQHHGLSVDPALQHQVERHPESGSLANERAPPASTADYSVALSISADQRDTSEAVDSISGSCTTRAGTDRPVATDDEDQHLDAAPESATPPIALTFSTHPKTKPDILQSRHVSFPPETPLLHTGSDKRLVFKDDHQNVNLRAAYLHAAGDLIQNIGVLIAAGLIWLNPSWSIADPLCTFLFSLLVLATTLSILMEAVNVLMEGTPKEVDLRHLREDLQRITFVTEIHDLHVWSLSIGKPSLACHIVVDTEEEARRVLRRATQICQEKYGILHTTIQIDYSANKLACDTDAHSKCH